MDAVLDQSSCSTLCASAREQAQANLRNNLQLLVQVHGFATDDISPACEVVWDFARDGFLSAKADGQWLAGRSVPYAAAREALKKATIIGTTACFLLPSHAAELAAALERLEENQAIIAIVASSEVLALILSCADFTEAMRADRLFFVVGASWAEALEVLFAKYPGLATPTQFLRMPWASKEHYEPVMTQAQELFQKTNEARARWLNSYGDQIDAGSSRAAAEPLAGRVCVYAPMKFALWCDGGWMLSQVAEQLWGDGHIQRCNPDRPTQATALALAHASMIHADTAHASLAQAGESCDSLLALNLGRGNRHRVFALDRPWITWVTDGNIPQAVQAAKKDRLILADPQWVEAALTCGWDKEAVHVAAPGAMPIAQVPERPMLGLIADLPELKTPQQVLDQSSQRLVWEAIGHELPRNPFLIGTNIHDYLRRHMHRYGIEPASYDGDWWIQALVTPSWQIGIVRWMQRNKIPLGVWGKGWRQAELADGVWRGEIRDRQAFVDALNQCSAVVHAWPQWAGHPVAHCGRVVLEVAGLSEKELRRKMAAMRQRQASGADIEHTPVLSAEILREVLRKG